MANLDNQGDDFRLDTYPDKPQNAKVYHTPLGKVFISSLRDIKANEEIFISYGWRYWRNALKQLHAAKKDGTLHMFH